MLEHAAHLAVLALPQGERDPGIAALPALEAGDDRTIGHAVDRDPLFESGEAVGIDLAMNAHLVTPEPPRRRQFEPPAERTVIGQQQKSFGIEIEATDRNHPR